MLSRCRPLLGTYVEIAADSADAIDAAFVAVEAVHRLMSAHEPDSDVSSINRFAHCRTIEVHAWTARVIERSLFWSNQSVGTFDVVRAGKRAVERGLLPRHPDQMPPQASHWSCLEIHGNLVRLLEPGCIDLGGIAKGFAVDRAVDALRGAGCQRGLVNAGGDLRAFGADPWPATVIDPLARRPLTEIGVDNEALATSGGLPTGTAQLSFGHLAGLNPRWISVSVLARTACDADALTKIVWAEAENSVALLEKAGARALGVTADGEVELIGEMAKAGA